MIYLLGLALLAGVLSFLSPCVLPLAPLYIAYFAGVDVGASGRGKSKLGLNLSLFFIGFSVVYLLLGFSFSLFIAFIQRYYIFKIVIGLILIIFALHYWKVFQIPFLYADTRKMKVKEFNVLSSFIFGILFALGWSPCMGPLLGNVIVLASNSTGIFGKILVLFMFCVGIIIPFIVLAVASVNIKKGVSKLSKFSRYIEIFSGVLLFFLGIWLLINIM